jgi:hypothetical protein
MAYWFRARFQARRMRGDYLAINKSQLAMLPIRVIDGDSRDGALCNRVSDLARERLGLVRGSQSAKEMLPRQAEELERRIDELVYRLYRLSDDEIAEVETEVANLGERGSVR